MGVVSPVVSEVVVLLLVLGQAVYQVIRRLVGDVREEPVHDVHVPVQLELDGVPEGSVEVLVWLLSEWNTLMFENCRDLDVASMHRNDLV